MAFFAVQVHTGAEIKVKEKLEFLLNKHSWKHDVKAVYALETYTELVNENKTSFDFSELDNKDICEFMQLQRMRMGLANLRQQYVALKRHTETEISLVNTYKEKICELTSEIKDFRQRTKQVTSLLKGYILVEIQQNFWKLPNELWHLIKSVPQVVNILKNSIPDYEIKSFFNKIKVTPEIELELDNILSLDEINEIENELLEKANEIVGTKQEKEILEQIDELHVNIETEVETIAQSIPVYSPIKNLVSKVNTYMRYKKEIVLMPIVLFKQMYKDIETHFTKKLLNKNDYLSRLRKLAEFNRYGKEVLE